MTDTPHLAGQTARNNDLVKSYYAQFGHKYRQASIFEHYPETKTIPAYIMAHFVDARLVLDLGFGTGLWFWASFLPALQRIDGVDADREALEEADKVFQVQEVPEGFRLAHARMGRAFTLADLRQLQNKRGRFVFQDYRQPWPDVLADTRYDLVTEHGGGLGQMDSDDEFIGVVRQAAGVLMPRGHLLFVNFQMEPSALEKRVGKVASPTFNLRSGLFTQAAEQAGLRMRDFHTIDRPADMPNVETFYYGYAQKL